MKSTDNLSQNKNKGVLEPLGISSSVSLIYVIFFVSISLVAGKNITMDKVALPAISLYLIISAIEYLFSRKSEGVSGAPKIFSVVSLIVSLMVAFFMALAVP